MGNYDFDLDLPDGQEGEQRLKSLLSGAWEVKRDHKVSETGNVAIEYEDRGEASGITQSPAEWWGIWLDGPGYDMEVVVLIKRDRLRAIAKGCHFVSGGDGGWAVMSLVPVGKLVGKVEEKPGQGVMFSDFAPPVNSQGVG